MPKIAVDLFFLVRQHGVNFWTSDKTTSQGPLTKKEGTNNV